MSRSGKRAENSVGLRVITSAMAIVGILAACQLAETKLSLTVFGLCGTILGSYVSYRRRNANNFWIKWGLAAGILVVLGVFVEEIFYRIQASIADARAPLTNMLIALQALHSFDLPGRRDLNISALVGLVLLASAATLSRDLAFGVYLLVFICFGSYMLYLDCHSRTRDDTREPAQSAGQPEAEFGPLRADPKSSQLTVALLVGAVPLVALVFFMLMPKLELGLLNNVRVSLKLDLPLLRANRISNPLLSRARRADGSLMVNPQAYFGFDEELDLNYRGELSDQIVMRVASPSGEFWRAMAFDTWNGSSWTMSQPRKTFDRLAVYGSAIPLAPVPSLSLTSRVPTVELNQVFYLETDQPNLIPAAAVPSLIYFPTNKVEVDSYGSLRSPVAMERDMVYTVFSQVPRYNLAQLRHTEPLPERNVKPIRQALGRYFQLPEALPSAVLALGDRVAGPNGSWFARAERINNYLKLHYQYNLKIPPTPDREDAVADFLLRRKSGYCEHFASAFVILCRSQGIPARLVTGFTPGEYNPFTGLWEVRMRDAHAWAEVFLPRWGWIQFDPTPDGVPPAFHGRSAHPVLDYVIARLAETCKLLGKQPALTAAIKTLSAWLASLSSLLSSAAILTTVLWQPLVVVMFLVAAGVLIVIYGVPFLERRQQGRGQPAMPARHRATRYFLRLCQDLAGLHMRRLPQDTAAELAGRLRQCQMLGVKMDEELPELIDRFMEHYSAARFGPRGDITELAVIGDRIHDRVLASLPDKSSIKMSGNLTGGD